MGRRVMIVEDNEDLLQLLSERLKMAGFEVTVATDSATAMGMVHKAQPELIILDLLMPAGGGLGMLKNLKLSVKTKLIPIIVLTAAENNELRQQAEAIGVTAYLQKPYDSAELLSIIKRQLGIVENA